MAPRRPARTLNGYIPRPAEILIAVNPVEKGVRRIDRWQQEHAAAAFVFGVIKKFGDDNGGSLVANLAYSALAATFPLLLLLVTILGIVLAGDPALRERVINSALAQFPIIGGQLRNNVHALRRSSTAALVVSLLGLVWTSTRLSQAGLFTMSQVWNLPGPDRPDYWHRLLRSLGFLGVLALGLAVTTGLASFGVLGTGIGYSILAFLFVTVISIGQYMLAFRVLTSRVVPTRKLWPGAVAGGLAWTILQAAGGYLLQRQLRGSSQVYGTFAIVIGLLAWVYIGVQITVYAAELNTVLDRHLWPRSIVQPPLTHADRVSLALQARENQRRPEQEVSVSFADDAYDAERR
jgi:YihY family inner membrane protein